MEIPYRTAFNTQLKQYTQAFIDHPITYKDSKYKIYTYNEKKLVPIASNTKLLNALTALDYIDNLDEKITIDKFDINEGTGPSYKGGEVLSIREILYNMFLPSSNTCARALAHYIGNKLLNDPKLANEHRSYANSDIDKIA